MKTFSIWLSVSIALFGALFGAYHAHLTMHPRKVLVVVDSSFHMTASWDLIPDILDNIDNARYSRYALWTEKAEIHDWHPSLRLGRTVPFAPRNFQPLIERLDSDAVEESTRRIIVTNANERDLDGFEAWEVIHVER